MCAQANLTILHAAPLIDGFIGGPAFSVTGQLKALHEEGVSVALLTTNPSGVFSCPQPYPVFAYRDLPQRKFSALPLPFNQPDLIEFHSTYIPAQAYLAWQASQRRIPYLITPRGGMNRGAQARKRWKKHLGNLLFFSNMVRKAGAIHCLTPMEAAETALWGRPIFVVGNGVDLPSMRSLARPGHGNRLRIIFLGRLDVDHKGLDLLLKGWALAKATLKKVGAELIIYGPDPGDEKAVLTKCIGDYGLESMVQLKGVVLGEEKALVFSEADVFVHTSRHEGHPMAVLEALSYGLPCLLTPGTNVAFEVQSAGAGWQVEPTPESIAQGLIEISRSQLILQDMGRAGRALIDERYTWKRIGQQLIEQYRRFLTRPAEL
jgi:glycosyltransferase involved in cell wall biosynthesis